MQDANMLMYWRNLKLRAQRVHYIFSEITLGTAAPVVDTSGNNFHRRPLCHLKLSLAQHFDRCCPLHTAAASHVSQQSDPMRHGKLLESTSHTHTHAHNTTHNVLLCWVLGLSLPHNCCTTMSGFIAAPDLLWTQPYAPVLCLFVDLKIRQKHKKSCVRYRHSQMKTPKLYSGFLN